MSQARNLRDRTGRPMAACAWRWVARGGLPVVASAAVLVAGCGGDDGSSARADQGRELADERGCTTCHTANGDPSTGPTWKGIWGTNVTLEDGTTVTVDRDYIARAVRDPQAEIVEGFTVQMPTFDLSDDEIADLVAYIESLGPSDAVDSDGLSASAPRHTAGVDGATRDDDRI